ncbi:sulfite exporter TauE/SafE family protein, partial [Salmonella enterica subsp. enterica serovar Infantis]
YAFQILRIEKKLFVWMFIVSVLGSAIGVLMLGMFPVRVLMTLLCAVLIISAIKNFNHTRQI